VTGRDQKPVVIVGGGVSGLAAAVRLTASGVPVVLLEQRAYAGGRAYSFIDRRSGESLDNGQHLLIAGYAATFRYLRAIGADHLVHVQPQPVLQLHHPRHGFGRLALPALPSPLHFAAGIMRFPLLTVNDRLGLLRAGVALHRLRAADAVRLDGMTIAGWLDAQNQSDEARRTFWEPLAVSILNETTAAGSAWPFLHALRVAFLGSRNASALAVPAVGLSDLLVNPAVKMITRHGGVVRTSADVAALDEDGRGVRGVVLRTGEQIDAAAVILAVPWHEIPALIPASLRTWSGVEGLAVLRPSPIVCVHLWFERDAMDHAVAGLADRRVQWLFNRRRLVRGGGEGGHLSAVISGAHAFMDMPPDDLIRLAVEDIRTAYPAFPSSCTAGIVIKEKRATPSFVPGTQAIRPDVRTPIRNLFLAGDWTDTGLPATLEGAVLSGERAASEIEERRVKNED
jgi:zeta-carotene desaturase